MEPILSSFTFNIGEGVKYRYDELEGEKYLVVPMVMLTEGVHNGSNGPGYYPADENAKAAPSWNHMPIVVYHPEKNGKPTSARQAPVLNARKIGLVLNTQHVEEKKGENTVRKLRAEAWINENRANKIDKRIVENIKNGKKTEVSTGLYSVHEETEGVWNGEKYQWIARDHKPDHLAVLPDQVGACSIKDGAGLLANALGDALIQHDFQLALCSELLMLLDNRDFTSEERKKAAKSGAAMPDGSFPIEDEGDLKNAIRAVGRAKNPEAAKRHIKERAKSMGLTSLIPSDWNAELVENAMSYGDKARHLQKALAAKHGEPGKEWYGYISDVYDDKVIYSQPGDSNLYAHKYKQNGDSVALDGDPVPVVRTTDYQPVKKGSSGPKETTNMAFDKNAHIASLIGNGFAETDRVWLTALTDEQLAKVKPVTTNTAPPITTNTAPAPTPPAVPVGPQTVEQYIKALPPQVQVVLNRGLAADNAMKQSLIDKITKNADGTPRPNCAFSVDYLQTQDTDFLSRVAALIPDEVTTNSGAGASIYGPPLGGPSYIGANVPSPTWNSAPIEEEPLAVAPTINFDNPLEKGKKKK